MKWPTFLGHLILISNLHAETPEGAALLDQVISRPGSYSQVCDIVTAPEDIPYRAFTLTDPNGASFSKSNLAAIGKNRGALVKSIRARLLAVDFTRKIQETPEDPKPEHEGSSDIEETGSGCDPASLNPLILELIHQLHAIETLPELLTVEQKLVKGIASAKEHADAPPPLVDGWFVASETDLARSEDAGENQAGEKPLTDEEKVRSDEKRDRKVDLFQARVAQRDLVILMAMLMREESFAPYLKSSFETACSNGLRAGSKEELAKIKPGEPIPEEIEIDPVTRYLRDRYTPVKIPYTRESRDEIRAIAAQWITAHP